MASLLDDLTTLANSFESIEGNCYTYHLTSSPAPELCSKQTNLGLFAKDKKNILEIGFNAGHSAAIFLQSNPDVKLTCIDIGIHKYTIPCYEHLRKLFPSRIQLIIESSINLTKLPLPLRSFDGVHVDGNHEDPWYIYDTTSCLRFMTDSAQLIMDDSNHPPIAKWCQFMEKSILFKPSEAYQRTHMYEHRIFDFTRPRYGICTVIIGEKYSSIVNECSNSLKKYCEKWNISLIVQSESLDHSRPLAWTKIPLLQKHLNDYDVLFWIDADIMIMNDEWSLDERLLFMSKDMLIALTDPTIINSGSFAIRNTKFSHDFLQEIYDQTQFIDHDWWENKALIHLLETQTEKRNHVDVIPYQMCPLLNVFPQETGYTPFYQPGDWLVHFASHKGDGLRKLVESFSQMTVNSVGLSLANLKFIADLVNIMSH